MLPRSRMLERQIRSAGRIATGEQLSIFCLHCGVTWIRVQVAHVVAQVGELVDEVPVGLEINHVHLAAAGKARISKATDTMPGPTHHPITRRDLYCNVIGEPIKHPAKLIGESVNCRKQMGTTLAGIQVPLEGRVPCADHIRGREEPPGGRHH